MNKKYIPMNLVIKATFNGKEIEEPLDTASSIVEAERKLYSLRNSFKGPFHFWWERV